MTLNCATRDPLCEPIVRLGLARASCVSTIHRQEQCSATASVVRSRGFLQRRRQHMKVQEGLSPF